LVIKWELFLLLSVSIGGLLGTDTNQEQHWIAPFVVGKCLLDDVEKKRKEELFEKKKRKKKKTKRFDDEE